MTLVQNVVAVFACSFLSVSLTLPVLAREAEGIVAGIDEDGRHLILVDGSRYQLPETQDYSALRPGMQIHLLYESATD